MTNSKDMGKDSGSIGLSMFTSTSSTHMGSVSITNPCTDQLEIIINATVSTAVEAAVDTGVEAAITKIDHKQIKWYQNYSKMIENMQRIKTNFVDPFTDQSYNYIHNALPEFEVLENDRETDLTDGLLTDLLQGIASAAYLGRTLNNQIILLTKQWNDCTTSKQELLDKIQELEDALLVHSGQQAPGELVGTNIKWSAGAIKGGIPLLFIIGRYNIMLAWYNYYYFNKYNPTATIEPQKYLFIKQMVEAYGIIFDPVLGMSPALAELKRLEQETFD